MALSDLGHLMSRIESKTNWFEQTSDFTIHLKAFYRIYRSRFLSLLSSPNPPPLLSVFQGSIQLVLFPEILFNRFPRKQSVSCVNDSRIPFADDASIPHHDDTIRLRFWWCSEESDSLISKGIREDVKVGKVGEKDVWFSGIDEREIDDQESSGWWKRRSSGQSSRRNERSRWRQGSANGSDWRSVGGAIEFVLDRCLTWSERTRDGRSSKIETVQSLNAKVGGVDRNVYESKTVVDLVVASFNTSLDPKIVEQLLDIDWIWVQR